MTPPRDGERLDLAQFGQMLRERRGALSLRQAAAEAGVSFSTFSRVESGAQPDITSFSLLCGWLGEPPSSFFSPIAVRQSAPLDEAIAHLSADPRLGPDASAKIVLVMRSMYEALADDPVPATVLTCHLRASSVLRPGVPARLTRLLREMDERLADMVRRGEL
jgi:transcriptional regulator with XRE-family HTH domain